MFVDCRSEAEVRITENLSDSYGGILMVVSYGGILIYKSGMFA